MLILTSCSIVIFLLGSKVSNIKIKSYFSAADFTVKTIAAYCVISFLLDISPVLQARPQK